MSLSLGSFVDTARSTFKGLAVAAAGTEEARTAVSAPAAPAAPAPVVAAPAERSEPKAAKSRRLGTVLDAYA